MADSPKRVVLLGAESTGKTTLARSLAGAYSTVWNPEYGRAYTELGRPRGTAWTSEEFTHIARLQCWYEDQLAGCAQRVLFCDTDAHTTAVFHEIYLGAPTGAFDDLTARTYDLQLLCGLDVPWEGDAVREFAAGRRWMHERFIERCERSGRPWVLLEGPHETRVAASRSAVDALLAS
ncbi:MAG: ATPase [Thermoleophilia bacterium]|nr:ATPase [Thermoleophilia bacterium]